MIYKCVFFFFKKRAPAPGTVAPAPSPEDDDIIAGAHPAGQLTTLGSRDAEDEAIAEARKEVDYSDI